jgi:phage shock protein PspC (stress-responsive transcriptional regulator)
VTGLTGHADRAARDRDRHRAMVRTRRRRARASGDVPKGIGARLLPAPLRLRGWAAAFAHRYDINPLVARLGAIASVAVLSPIVYIATWILMPEEAAA